MVVGPPPCLISRGSISSTFFFEGHSYRKEENLNIRHSQNGDQKQAGSQIAEYQAQANRKRCQTQITP